MADIVCVNKFKYVPEDDTYYAYISQFDADNEDLFQPLWKDSDDVGFRLRAHSDPSMYVEYMLADTEHHQAGEVATWIFVAVPDSHTMRMGKLDSRVRIINF